MADWDNFTRVGKRMYEYLSFYSIDIKASECNCKYFVKLGYCAHLLALKALLKNDQFVNKAKKGRPKNSEKSRVYESF